MAEVGQVEGHRLTVEFAREDAQTLCNLAASYRTASAHEMLWHRLYDSLTTALSVAGPTHPPEEAP